MANIQSAVEEAQAPRVGLLCLAELCLCGYGCEDAFFAPATRRMVRRVAQELLSKTQGIAVTLGLPVMHRGSPFNACAFVVDDRLIGLVPKQHLAGDGLHYEPRWFKPWPRGVVTGVEIDCDQVPHGDLLFDLRGVRVGFEFFEDA